MGIENINKLLLYYIISLHHSVEVRMLQGVSRCRTVIAGVGKILN
jgi:hypothetical protein